MPRIAQPEKIQAAPVTGLADFPASVTFMPGMRSGQPTIGGTRLPLSIVLENMWCDGVEFVTQTWECTREQCLVAAWFAGLYGIDDLPTPAGRRRGGVWQKRFGEWASFHSGALWSGELDEIPDPPTVDDQETPS
jgi:uncharacterized protein (DUF433 family)